MCHTFKDINIHESLINDLGLDGISGDESIAEVEDNEECLSADNIHPGLITKIRALFSMRVPPPCRSTINWSFIPGSSIYPLGVLL